MSLNQYLSEVNAGLASLDPSLLQESILMFKQTIKNGNMILVAGNGGSAAIASHFVTDLSRCTMQGNHKINALSLCDNQSLLTATANDFGYEHVFEYQIDRIAQEGDLLVLISSSGNSTNILKALEIAKEKKVKTMTLTGFDGGKASKLSDIPLIVKTEINNYGPTEDTHSILCHYFARILR
jgi:D-sedoheptulose 7-phosphate isomerase